MGKVLILFSVFSTLFSIINGFDYLDAEEEALKSGSYGKFSWTPGSYPAKKMNELISADTNLLKTVGLVEEWMDTSVERMETCRMCNTLIGIKIRPLSYVDGAKKYFLVHAKNYTQTEIILNVCSPNQNVSRCFAGATPQNYRQECIQKYTTMNVLVYNEMENEFMGKEIPYESACECTIQNY